MNSDIRFKRSLYTPAYALSGDSQVAIDLLYQKAESLRNALPAGVVVHTKAIVPFESEYVSGLNTPTNFTVCVGRQAINRHQRMQRRAIKALEARNA